MNDKERIKRLLKIAETQQKIITKLAQAQMPETEEQKKARWESERKALVVDGMFSYGKLSADNPYRHDPFYAGEKSNVSTLAEKPKAHTDAAVGKIENKQPVSNAPQAARQPPAPAKNMLPSGLYAALDKGAPGLKGAVNVKVDGKNLDISYNADYVKGKLGLSPNEVKRVIMNAVAPLYQVTNVVGYNNPDATSWKPNYT